MAHWGVAYAAGPNYNMPWERRDAKMRADTAETCHSATRAALALSAKVTPFERAMIEALPSRFPQRTPEELEVMRGWNDDYANAMRGVYEAFPGDLDVACVFVEAIMNRTPWRRGTRPLAAWRMEPADGSAGSPGKDVRSIWILRPSRTAPPLCAPDGNVADTGERLKAADALRELVPDAGHLMHMPTHIDVQCGTIGTSSTGTGKRRRLIAKHWRIREYTPCIPVPHPQLPFCGLRSNVVGQTNRPCARRGTGGCDTGRTATGGVAAIREVFRKLFRAPGSRHDPFSENGASS